MADDAKPVIPGPKPGDAVPAAKPAVAATAAAPAVPVTTIEPVKPMAEQVQKDAPPADSFQADRETDPHENHDFLEEAFKRDQSAPTPVDMSAADIVASLDPMHTIAKGLTKDGQSSNGMVDGDRPLDRN